MTRFATSAILVAALAAPSPAAAQHQAGGAPSSGTATSSAPASSSSGSSSSSPSSGGSSSASTYAAGSTSSGPGRVRGNQPVNGTAVPRGSVGSGGTGGTIVIGEGGFYPWGYPFGASLAYAGLGSYYYGGYYGAYDPWYGWFPTFAPGGSYSSAPDHTGSVRLRVKPEDASVYVDGFLAGVVDDFDGAFQRLKLLPGTHRIEIRAQNYRPLAVDVMIQEDFTITYRGELAKP